MLEKVILDSFYFDVIHTSLINKMIKLKHEVKEASKKGLAVLAHTYFQELKDVQDTIKQLKKQREIQKGAGN